MQPFNERDFLEGLLLSFMHSQFSRWSTSDKLGGMMPTMMPAAETILTGATHHYLHSHAATAAATVDQAPAVAPAAAPAAAPSEGGTVITINPAASMAEHIAGATL